MKNYDTIIIGAGIIGSSIAYNLVRDGYDTKKILVVDKDTPAGEKSSTALSAGGFRNLWTTDVNIKLSTYSIKEYEKLQNEEKMNIGFDKAGYLFLKNKKQWKQAKKIAKFQKEKGVNLDILKLKEVKKLVPSLNFKLDKEIKEYFNIEDIAGGIIGHDCGFIDGYLLSTSLLTKAKDEGATIKVRTEITDIIQKDNIIEGVKTKQGETYLAPVVINAAGPYSAKIGKMLGIEIPVVPINRQLFVTLNPYQGVKFPMIVLDNGAYMRSELADLLFGRANEDEPVAKEINNEFLVHSDSKYYMDEIYPYFLAKLPDLEKGAKIKAKWGGLYEYNKEDHNGIIGQHPELKGFYICGGFSGHGIMEGFAAGKCISDLILKGDYFTIPEAKQLRFERFKEGRLIKELEVI